jgi:hypothetical protein
MIEQVAYGSEPFHVPELNCDMCGKSTHRKDHTQVYEVVIRRPKVKRTWFFCSLGCLNDWSKPLK